ncbi:MAG: hypothetical protein DME65_13620, partial [Verrucomicrobia bacterium]
MKLRSYSILTIVCWAFMQATTLCVLLAAKVVAQTASPTSSPSQPAADYDVRWGVKIPMRDNVELNATLYLPKTPDGSLPKTPVIFTLT